MFVRHLEKGQIVYREFEVPRYFFVLHSGLLAVQKQVEVHYSNLWPAAAGGGAKKEQEWTHLKRTQNVNKVLQHIVPGMYFGQHEILTNTSVPCRVVVASEKAVLLGFPAEAMEKYFEPGRHRNDLLSQEPLVRFPHESEVRCATIIQWKAKAL
jgi:CRP-like cAMP-binding protein